MLLMILHTNIDDKSIRLVTSTYLNRIFAPFSRHNPTRLRIDMTMIETIDPVVVENVSGAPKSDYKS
jgi:hypothetical protein